jgi:hypothetical protein
MCLTLCGSTARPDAEKVRKFRQGQQSESQSKHQASKVRARASIKPCIVLDAAGPLGVLGAQAWARKLPMSKQKIQTPLLSVCGSH